MESTKTHSLAAYNTDKNKVTESTFACTEVKMKVQLSCQAPASPFPLSLQKPAFTLVCHCLSVSVLLSTVGMSPCNLYTSVITITAFHAYFWTANLPIILIYNKLITAVIHMTCKVYSMWCTHRLWCITLTACASHMLSPCCLFKFIVQLNYKTRSRVTSMTSLLT